MNVVYFLRRSSSKSFISEVFFAWFYVFFRAHP